MLRRLLILEHDGIAEPVSLAMALPRNYPYTLVREPWHSFDPRTLAHSQTEAIVARVGGESDAPLRFFRWLKNNAVREPVLAILPADPGDELLALTAEVCDDLLISPVRAEELSYRLARVTGPSREETENVRKQLVRQRGLERLVGEDPTFVEAIGKIPAVALSRSPVLLRGETGTGKELCAHAIHSFSSRHAGPFVPVDCGALPEQLIENELFGHTRGAYTDAHSDQQGLVGMAEGGTLFLDEIDSLPLAAQGKLLRFIAEGWYRPVGSQKFMPSDVRLIAASNGELEEGVRKGEFRRDLFFRLNVLPLLLPALRQRPADIPTLARHFLAQSDSTGQKQFAQSALRALKAHDWPGNVRELFNIVQRAVAFSSGKMITVADLSLQAGEEAAESEATFRETRVRVVENFERQYIEEMLRKHHGNVTHAAAEANKDRRVFGRLMKKYNISRY